MSRFTFTLNETVETTDVPLQLIVTHKEVYSNQYGEVFPGVLSIEGSNPNGYTWTYILKVIIQELEKMYGYNFDLERLKEEE